MLLEKENKDVSCQYRVGYLVFRQGWIRNLYPRGIHCTIFSIRKMNGCNIGEFGVSMASDTRKPAASTVSTPFPQQNVTQLC